MRKVEHLLKTKRTKEEAYRIVRILHRLFRNEKSRDPYFYKFCFANLLFKGRRQHIKDFFARYNIEDKVSEKTYIIKEVPIDKIEAVQTMVSVTMVNMKVFGDTNHRQKDPEVDVTYPTLIYNSTEDIYYIFDGNSRINAAMILGEETIKCRVVNP